MDLSFSSYQPCNGAQDQSEDRQHGPDETSAPQGHRGMQVSRPPSHILTKQEQDMIAHLDRLKFFLATAPSLWESQQSHGFSSSHTEHPAINRFLLPSGEYVSCVLWSGLYHITGTDIIRALVFRFAAFSRPVRNMKKFEEGVFSDLRNLKPGHDACLEEPKSPFLDLLFRHQCIRTQKKQKVFYWFSVPHDRLFLDALERDLKREKLGQEPTTVVVGEPARSFTYDPKRPLYEQFSQMHGSADGEGDLERAVRQVAPDVFRSSVLPATDLSPNPNPVVSPVDALVQQQPMQSVQSSPPNPNLLAPVANASNVDQSELEVPELCTLSTSEVGASEPMAGSAHSFAMISLFAGNPNYKQRRGKVPRGHKKMGVARTSSTYLVPSSSRDATTIRATSTSGQEHIVTSRYPSATPALPDEPTYTPDHASTHGGLASASSHGDSHRPDQELAIPCQTCTLSSSPSPEPPSIPGTSQTLVGNKLVATKAYACPLFSCGRIFKRMEHLKRHLLTHTPEKPFQCIRCHKRFRRSDNLSQHLRTHFTPEAEHHGVDVKFETDHESDSLTPWMYEVGVGGAVERSEEGLITPDLNDAHRVNITPGQTASPPVAETLPYTEGFSHTTLQVDPIRQRSCHSLWDQRHSPEGWIETYYPLSESPPCSNLSTNPSQHPSHPEDYPASSLHIPRAVSDVAPIPLYNHTAHSPSFTNPDSNCRYRFSTPTSSDSLLGDIVGRPAVAFGDNDGGNTPSSPQFRQNGPVVALTSPLACQDSPFSSYSTLSPCTRAATGGPPFERSYGGPGPGTGQMHSASYWPEDRTASFSQAGGSSAEGFRDTKRNFRAFVDTELTIDASSVNTSIEHNFLDSSQ